MSRFQKPALLFLLYFLWGATYLGIRVGVQTIPPFFVGAFRYSVGGFCLYLILKCLKRFRCARLEARNALFVGMLTAGVSNGAMIYAEKTVDSSIVAIAFTCMPLFLLLINAVAFERKRPAGRDLGLLLLGFVGTFIVLSSGHNFGGNSLTIFEWTLLIGCPFFWALGSLWGRKLKMPTDILTSATLQMAGGALLLGVCGFVQLAMGKPWDIHQISAESILGCLYLATFGSLLGYTIFAYLISTWDPQVVGTYAFACPIVAITLGILYGEQIISAPILIGAAIAICSVAGRVLLAIWERPARV